MKIAIVNNMVPFIYGGAEILADNLKDKLIEYGHEVIVVRIPFSWHPAQKIIENLLACQFLNFDLFQIDKLIALKFPVYSVKHPNKTIWLLHQFRQAYELWGTEYQELPNTTEGIAIRDMIIRSDNDVLGKEEKIYTISDVVTNRLKEFNGFDSEVLYPPLMFPERYSCGDCGDYMFFPSRITLGKRQHLAVEAMRYTRSDVKLIIAGKPDSDKGLVYIQNIIKKNNLDDKVEVIGEWISDEKKNELFANSLGVLFIPYREDYGYVSLEACYSKKPIVTCNDSGGPLAFVDDKVNGFVTSNDPKEIAEAMDRLYLDKRMAETMGRKGLEKIKAMNINWDFVINKLIE